MLDHLVHRLTTGALVAAGLAVVPLLAAPVAQAVVATGPTAVAVSSTGTTYAGTAAGGSLTRVDATGAVGAPLPLPRSGPVDGLAFAPDGDLWVSYGSGASKVDATTGAERTYLDTLPPDCAATDADDPGTYGGIVATATEVVVAHRCGSAIGLNAYRLVGGTWQATGGASPVGGGRFGDLARGPASGGRAGSAHYLTVPDRGVVEVRSGFDDANATPIRTIALEPRGGGVTPRPVGVAVDDQGQVFVVDAANHVVHVYNQGGTEYDRYVGNPPDPDSYLGGFDRPSSVAQFPRDGSVPELQGNLFVADSGNDRVQRLNTYGYAFWAAPTDGTPSTPGSPPLNTTLPSVSGTPSVGQVLTCDPGTWARAPTFGFGWNRDNGFLAGEDAATYTVRAGDAGRKISCFVQGSNAAGTSDFKTSANVTISTSTAPPVASAPVSTIAPTIAGTPQPGATLTCGNGSWTGSPIPTYTRQWLRDGTPVAGADQSSYTVLAGDLGTTLSCLVTATNTAGTATRASAGVTVTATTPPSGCPGVANTVSIDGAAVFTTDAAVSLTVRPPAGATQVLISNDGGFDTAQVRAVSADCRYPWALAVGGGTATKTVYVRFAGGGLSETTVGPQDDIVLDGTAPALPAPRITAGRRDVFTVTLRASDRVSGLARVQHAATRGARGTTVRYRGSFTTRSPRQFAWVRVHDKAGNVSPWTRSVRVRR